MTDAWLLEIFSSIQGEATWLGRRQIFIRFGCCNRSCAYCDTSVEPSPNCRVERKPGEGAFVEVPNPVSWPRLRQIITSWIQAAPRSHHSISITGGEPLLQVDTLRQWLPALRSLLPIYLETNGTLPAVLEELLPHLDYIAMDIKLASMTGEPTPWQAHGDFLRLAAGKEGCVKIVIDQGVDTEELEQAAAMAAVHGPGLPVILQPRSGGSSLPGAVLMKFQEQLARLHPDVRVIPQMHRFMGLL
ncbi:MAG: 7-carboxy-7-deazaguanine synthase QueE [Deltaproteobacteria bacterium]|nr:7-carboxy-7-deazaguanine synthase QueE [Deltaproteobacteria bacterium]